jgi:hypothetical protein
MCLEKAEIFKFQKVLLHPGDPGFHHFEDYRPVMGVAFKLRITEYASPGLVLRKECKRPCLDDGNLRLNVITLYLTRITGQDKRAREN